MDKMGRTQRRLFLIGAASLTFGLQRGLVGPSGSRSAVSVAPNLSGRHRGEKVNWALAIMRPDVPGGLDTDRIALVQADGTMDYYAKATYPDRLSATLQRVLIEGFEASGRVTAIARAQEALHADYNLLIEVKDFQAVYKIADGCHRPWWP